MISKAHLATFFKQYAKYTKKNRDFIKSMPIAREIQSTKSARKCGYFRVNILSIKEQDDWLRGCYNIFRSHDV